MNGIKIGLAIILVHFLNSGVSQVAEQLKRLNFSEFVDSTNVLHYEDSSVLIIGYHQGNVAFSKGLRRDGSPFAESLFYKGLNLNLVYDEDGFNVSSVEMLVDSGFYTNRFFSTPTTPYLIGKGFPYAMYEGYSSDKIRERYTLYNGKHHGEYFFYNSEGKLMIYTEYKEGLLDGYSLEYYETGQLKSIQEFTKGQPLNKKILLSPEGTLITAP